MENQEIEYVLNALRSNQVHVMNELLKEKWSQNVSSFIETVSILREKDAALVDRHFNSEEFISQFVSRTSPV